MRASLKHVTTACFLVAVLTAEAQDRGFYRVASSQATGIVSFERDGGMVWSPAVTGAPFCVESTRAPRDSWETLAYGVVGQTTMSVVVPFPISPRPATNVMVLIPGGLFEMGDSFQEGLGNEEPVHTNYASAVYLDRFEASNREVKEVLQYALDRGWVSASTVTVQNVEGVARELVDMDDPDCRLAFTGGVFAVTAGMEDFPCQEMSWYGALALCNYRSDREGLDRCIDFVDWSCDFQRNGYRLPTEAEWEKAARGGEAGIHFPWPGSGLSWSNYIAGRDANYWGSGDPFDLPGSNYVTRTGYYDGTQLPAGMDRVNGYGLYDMAGNLSEFCWDRYRYGWYTNSAATVDNTTGPTNGLLRVARGGSWADPPGLLRIATRQGVPPGATLGYAGFRAARRF